MECNMEEQTVQQNPQPGASAPQAEAEQQVPDISPADRARKHYINVISELLDGAVKSKTLPALSNVMALNLAWIIVEYGSGAAGHVLETLGAHIAYLVERNRAAREAEAAREAGKLAH
jgi:hypothetical protein